MHIHWMPFDFSVASGAVAATSVIAPADFSVEEITIINPNSGVVGPYRLYIIDLQGIKKLTKNPVSNNAVECNATRPFKLPCPWKICRHQTIIIGIQNISALWLTPEVVLSGTLYTQGFPKLPDEEVETRPVIYSEYFNLIYPNTTVTALGLQNQQPSSKKVINVEEDFELTAIGFDDRTGFMNPAWAYRISLFDIKARKEIFTTMVSANIAGGQIHAGLDASDKTNPLDINQLNCPMHQLTDPLKVPGGTRLQIKVSQNSDWMTDAQMANQEVNQEVNVCLVGKQSMT